MEALLLRPFEPPLRPSQQALRFSWRHEPQTSTSSRERHEGLTSCQEQHEAAAPGGHLVPQRAAMSLESQHRPPGPPKATISADPSRTGYWEAVLPPRFGSAQDPNKGPLPQHSVSITAVSDLHLERRGGRHPPIDQLFGPQSASADVCALLGDIGDPQSESYRSFLRACSAAFPLVLVVPGNHEAHNDEGTSLGEVLRGLSDFLQGLPNALLLHNAAVTLRAGPRGARVRLLGSTLWSHLPDDVMVMPGSADVVRRLDYLRATMHDYKHVFAEPGRLITPAEVSTMHDANVRWLTEQLAAAADEGLRCAVLSHHVPTTRGTSHPRFADSPNGCTYASSLEHIMGDALAVRGRRHGQHAVVNGDSALTRTPPLPATASSTGQPQQKQDQEGPLLAVWMCGHTHYNFDINVNGTRVVSNQWGYGEDPERSYSPNFLVALPLSATATAPSTTASQGLCA